jgi:hypothetical protein
VLDHLGRSARHRLDGGAPVACRGERGDIHANSLGDLVPRDVRLRQGRADDAGIDQNDVTALGLNLATQEGELHPLGIKRS